METPYSNAMSAFTFKSNAKVGQAYRYHAKLSKSVRERTSRPASCQAGYVTQAYVLWASQFHSVSNTGGS